jgi:hypothetical protein
MEIPVDQPTQLGIGGCHEPGCIDEDGFGFGSMGCCCSSCVGGLGFRMVLYIGYLYIRLAQKYALTKCGLGDTPALYLTLIAI